VRLARVDPILLGRREFPVWATYFRRVLRHVAGFPDLRLLCPIRHLEGMRRTPASLSAPCSTTLPERTPFQGSSPVRVPAQTVSSCHFGQEPSGLPEFSDVSLPACHSLRTPADLHALAMNRALHVVFQHVKTVDIRGLGFSKLYQHFRERDLPYGLQDSLCTLAPYSCSRVTPLRNGTNTRYGWVASPYPTGTLTRQETPSFSRRDNAILS
jgi:hypothetical protein